MVIPLVLTMVRSVQGKGKAKLQVQKWEILQVQKWEKLQVQKREILQVQKREKILVPWSEKRWKWERNSGRRLDLRAWLTQVRLELAKGKEPWETMKEMAA